MSASAVSAWHWGSCTKSRAVTWGFKSNHPGGVNFAMVDGSVHFVSQNIDMRTYQYLGCRHDGMGVSFPVARELLRQ